ncbi:hypothetical protein AB1N83_004058 [Pleurotus pulmonarius]
MTCFGLSTTLGLIVSRFLNEELNGNIGVMKRRLRSCPSHGRPVKLRSQRLTPEWWHDNWIENCAAVPFETGDRRLGYTGEHYRHKTGAITRERAYVGCLDKMLYAISLCPATLSSPAESPTPTNSSTVQTGNYRVSFS